MHEANQVKSGSTEMETSSGIFSAKTKMFIHDYSSTTEGGINYPDERLIDKYALVKINDIYYIGMLLKISNDFNIDQLSQFKAITGSRTNISLSIKLPVQNVEKLAGVKGIEYADVDQKIDLRDNR